MCPEKSCCRGCYEDYSGGEVSGLYLFELFEKSENMGETSPCKKIYIGGLSSFILLIMRIKEGFKLREILGEYAVIGEGLDQVNYNKIISLNGTAAYLWKKIENIDFDEEMVADFILEKYDVDEETALRDAKDFVRKFVDNGLTL